MKVVIANGKNHRFALSYWATADFMAEYPDARWSWKGDGNASPDKRPGSKAVPLVEDISAAKLFEFVK